MGADRDESGEGVTAAPRPGARAAAIVFLLAAGGSWSAGNVGAVVADLSKDFGISLAAVGLLSGTLFLGFSAAGTLLAPSIIARIGIVRTILLAAVLGAAGNIVFAAVDSYALLGVGRAIAGAGLGLAVVAGPVFARVRGGVALVALFGAAIQLGIAGGLGIGAILVDAGVEWRLTFVLTAALALLIVPLLRGLGEVSYEPKTGGGFVRMALRSGRAWRISALFAAIFAVPLILGTWLVHYLSVDNSIAVGTAGVLSFVLFGVSGAARELGGKLAERGVSPVILIGLAPLLAAVGLTILAVDDTVGLALIAVILAGVGFAIPYGPGIVRAEALYPKDPAEPVALVSLVGTALPVPLVPLIGSLLDEGYGTEVFLAAAALVAAAGLLNMRPSGGPLNGR